jgi:hypothetical protein
MSLLINSMSQMRPGTVKLSVLVSRTLHVADCEERAALVVVA